MNITWHCSEMYGGLACNWACSMNMLNVISYLMTVWQMALTLSLYLVPSFYYKYKLTWCLGPTSTAPYFPKS